MSSIDDLLKETEAAKEKCLADRGPFRKKLESILKTFDQYAPVIDVMISHQPHITALVWGSIRGLLGVRISLMIACPLTAQHSTSTPGTWQKQTRNIFPPIGTPWYMYIQGLLFVLQYCLCLKSKTELTR